MTIIFKGTRPDHNIVYVQIYIYIQGRIQDLAQGGTNRARSARKIFCPPPELLRGGTGGDSPPPEIALSKDFAPFIK